MEERLSTQKLLQLRKLTRAVADLLRGQLKEYLATLSPLLRPRTILGDYVQSSLKENVRGAEKAFKDLQSLYESVAGAQPFHLAKELKAPIEIVSSTLEMSPLEYPYVAKGEPGDKTVSITSPLKWVLLYSGFPLTRFRSILADRNRSDNELREFVLHHLALHTVLARQTGITQMLEALHFPVRSETLPEFGQLPITVVSSTFSTMRPSDDVIIESTEISGTDAFEELVSIEDIGRMGHPFKEKLIEIVRVHGFDGG
ncbi:MAG: hypothetical protein L0387_34310 [Acidobacteria bacterium]|nr:hypothetical protein [Acidobacteriota bacterium]MCI0626667.1 hypothetical protein [Acidobacteriota bacterium]MCI0722494.1 hypothetical protein [Acidobacteriota bacterium]